MTDPIIAPTILAAAANDDAPAAGTSKVPVDVRGLAQYAQGLFDILQCLAIAAHMRGFLDLDVFAGQLGGFSAQAKSEGSPLRAMPVEQMIALIPQMKAQLAISQAQREVAPRSLQ